MKAEFLRLVFRSFILLCLLFLTIRNIKQATHIGAFGDNVGSGDFIWDSSRALLLHSDPYRQNSAWGQIEKEKNDFLWATYAPASLALMLPFATLNWITARNLWLAFNLCMTLGIFVFIRKTWLYKISLDKYLIFVLLVYVSGPWRDIFRLGQETLFSLGFFLIGYRLALAKRTVIAGIFLSFSLAKYTLTGPYLIWMALSGMGSSVGIAILLQCVLTAFSCYLLQIYPLSLFREYMGSVQGATFQGCTDIFSFAQNLFPDGSHRILIPIGILCITAALLWWWKRGRRDPLLALAVLSVWSMLIVYHGYYDMVLLVFPLILVFRDGIASRLHLILAIFIAELWYGIAHRLAMHLRASTHGGLDSIIIFQEVLVVFACLLSVDMSNPTNTEPVR